MAKKDVMQVAAEVFQHGFASFCDIILLFRIIEVEVNLVSEEPLSWIHRQFIALIPQFLWQLFEFSYENGYSGRISKVRRMRIQCFKQVLAYVASCTRD